MTGDSAIVLPSPDRELWLVAGPDHALNPGSPIVGPLRVPPQADRDRIVRGLSVLGFVAGEPVTDQIGVMRFPIRFSGKRRSRVAGWIWRHRILRAVDGRRLP